MKTLSSSENPVKDIVWKRVAKEHPEFTHDMDITDNYHTVGEIVLGGSIPWGRVHQLFKPTQGAQVMDVGANVGIFTAYCAANGAIVNAYEPSPEAFSELCNMLQMSRLGHCVLAHPEAIWTHRDIIPYSGNKTSMENCEWYNGAVLVAGINPSEFAYKGTVPCISFEDALRDIEWDMVKMDIEGAEFEVLLNTPERALRRIKFLFVEFHPWVSNGLYADVISKLQHVFNFEGYYSEKLARWEAAYCRKR